MLRNQHPGAEIHFLVRQGNEALVQTHPWIHKTWIWKKKEGKIRTLFGLIRDLRALEFDAVLNAHRFTSSGFLTWRLRAKSKVGFDKNPFSFAYSRKVKHQIPWPYEGGFLHEVQRNALLVNPEIKPAIRPRLFPSEEDYSTAKTLAADRPYVVLAPASVWYTKQLHPRKWEELLAQIPADLGVMLIGAPGDRNLAEQLVPFHPNARNLCGKLSFLGSVALMEGSRRVFCNDSAPMHLASAANTPTTAFFCGTIPAFGFGPLADNSLILEVKNLDCRPCNLHGKKSCPKGHFRCAMDMDMAEAVAHLELFP